MPDRAPVANLADPVTRRIIAAEVALEEGYPALAAAFAGLARSVAVTPLRGDVRSRLVALCRKIIPVPTL